MLLETTLKQRAFVARLTSYIVIVLAILWTAVKVRAYFRQESLNSSLIEAMKHRDAARAIRLLNQGADANVTAIPRPRTMQGWFTALRDRLHIGVIHTKLVQQTAPLSMFYEPASSEIGGVWLPCDHVPENSALVAALLNHGARPDAVDKYGKTALYYAVKSGHLRSARLLIEYHANCNLEDSEGRTLLFYSRGELIPMLVSHGANVNVRDQYGASPLMIAVLEADPLAAKQLVEIGARIEAVDVDGRTAAEWATQADSTACLKFLASRKARLDHRNSDGQTLLIVAVTNYCDWLRALRLEYAADNGQSRTFYQKHTDTIRWLLDHGADVNAKDKSGRSAIDYARLGDPALRHLLLKYQRKHND